jgi:hypothetical protein
LLCDRCTWKTPTLWCYYCWSMIMSWRLFSISFFFFGLKLDTLFEVLLLCTNKGKFFVTFQSEILVWGQF